MQYKWKIIVVKQNKLLKQKMLNELHELGSERYTFLWVFEESMLKENRYLGKVR